MHLSSLGSLIKPKSFTKGSVVLSQSFTQVPLGVRYFPYFSIHLSKHIYLFSNIL